MEKISREMQDELRAVFDGAIDEETVEKLKKKVSDAVADAQDYIMFDLKDQLARHLTGWVAGMAQRAVEQLLEGNEDQMRRYLSCEKRAESGEWIGWTGRSTGYTGPNSPIERQHSIIHGRLFEQGCVALRKKIVEAHRDLLVNERLLDLEDQVKSLVAQNVKLIEEREGYQRRLSGAMA